MKLILKQHGTKVSLFNRNSINLDEGLVPALTHLYQVHLYGPRLVDENIAIPLPPYMPAKVPIKHTVNLLLNKFHG